MNYNSIIVSGSPGSGKSTLVELLAALYNWPTHSIGQAFRDAWKREYPDGRVPFEVYWRSLLIEKQREVNIQAQRRVAQGNIIYDTRFAAYFEELQALRIFVTADIDVRGRRALHSHKYRGKLFADIRRILLERERDEVRIGKELLGSWYDYRDLARYHLTLDSGRLSAKEEVEEVRRLMKQKAPS